MNHEPELLNTRKEFPPRMPVIKTYLKNQNNLNVFFYKKHEILSWT